MRRKELPISDTKLVPFSLAFFTACPSVCHTALAYARSSRTCLRLFCLADECCASPYPFVIYQPSSVGYQETCSRYGVRSERMGSTSHATSADLLESGWEAASGLASRQPVAVLIKDQLRRATLIKTAKTINHGGRARPRPPAWRLV